MIDNLASNSFILINFRHKQTDLIEMEGRFAKIID